MDTSSIDNEILTIVRQIKSDADSIGHMNGKLIE